jgi:hypothetical protein
MNKTTEGDLRCVPCPHCEKLIRKPAKDVNVTVLRRVQKQEPCPHCFKLVHYEFWWVLKVKAGTERS